MKKIYIIGAGGFGREVAWLIERINNVNSTWIIQGFIDDNIEKQGKKEGKYPVVGTCSFLEECGDDVWVICAIGTSAVRKNVVEKVKKNNNIRFATLIDPSVLLSDSVSVGEGSIICAGNILTVDITIGKHVIINLDCTVGHDAVIEDFVTVYPSVNVSGAATVKQCTELGTGTQIIQGKRIEHGSVVGAGAVVTKDIPSQCVAVGMPARPIKYRKL